MPGIIRLGSIGGVDVVVSHSWFLVVALLAVLLAPALETVEPGLGAMAYVAGLAFALLVYCCVLLHEVSHALAARAFAMPVRAINLHFLGGATEIEGEAPTPWREFVIAVVGPLTSLALGGIAYAAQPAVPAGLLGFAVGALAYANIGLGLLNLVPGLPLDGGRCLQAVVWWVSRRRSLGATVAAWGGRVAAIAVACYPIALLLLHTQPPPNITIFLFTFLIATFLWTGATQSLMVSKLRSRLPALQARGLARRAIGVPADLPLAEGIRRAREADAGSLVVVSSDGRPTGIVNEAAVVSTPLERRPWLPCGDVARRLEDGLMLPVDIGGEQLIEAMRSTPATEYVLLDPSGSIFGVLVTKDVDEAFRTA